MVNNVPDNALIAEPLLLPTKPERGRRRIKCSINNKKLGVYISKTDVEKLEKGTIIRLKDLINIKINQKRLNDNSVEAEYHSTGLDRNHSIIQWVPEKDNINVSILKPDGSLSEGLGESNLKDIPLEQTIQFERYGFINPIRRNKNTLFCYFTH